MRYDLKLIGKEIANHSSILAWRTPGTAGLSIYLVCERQKSSWKPQGVTWLGTFDLCVRDSLVAQMVKSLPALRETQVQSLGREDPLEKEMATHSSILAWKIPWVEAPGRLQSMGS